LVNTEASIMLAEFDQQSAVDNLCFPIILWSPTGSLRHVTPLARQMLGFDLLTGQSLAQRLHPDDRPAFAAHSARLGILPPEEVIKVQVRLQDGQGGWRYVECHSRNLLRAPGTEAYLSQLVDLTAQWEQDRATRQMQAAAESLVHLTLQLQTLNTPEDVLAEALQQARKMLTWDSAHVTLLEGKLLRIGATVGYGTVEAERSQYTLDESPWDQAALTTGEFQIHHDLKADGTRRRMQPEWANAHLAVPISTVDQPIGVLHFFSAKANAFNAADALNLLPLTQVVALALTRAYAHQRTQQEIEQHKGTQAQLLRRNRELDLIARTLQSANSNLQVSHILRDACQAMVEALGFDFAAAGVIAPDRTQVTMLAEFNNVPVQGVVGLSFPLDASYSTSHVIRTGKPYVSNDVLGDMRLESIRQVMIARGTRTLIVAPLVAQDEVIGTIGIDSLTRREVTLDELRMVMLLTQTISQSLRNAQLYEELQAERDSLEQRVQERTADLRRTRDQLQSFIDYSPSGIVLTDPTGGIIAANDLGRVVFQAMDAVSQSLLGDDLDALESGEQILLSVEVVAGDQGGDSEAIVELQLDGEKRAFLLNRFSIGSAAQAFNAVGYVISEVTEIKRLERSLREALSKEKELSDLKTRFVSTVSHEFRNPLAVVRSSAEMLLMYRARLDNERIEERLKKIIFHIDHLAVMMDDVVTLTRAQQSRLPFKPQPTDLTAFCGEVIKEFNGQPGHEDRIHLQAAPGLRAEIDPGQMRKVLQNVLSNALKFSQSNDRVEVNLLPGDASITISVRDYGIGISEGDQAHLFETFFRAANVGMIPGTGLGLVIARNAVELHQGSLSLSSALGQGTTVTICIPVHQPVLS
jgi:signal transduction histidine kinase